MIPCGSPYVYDQIRRLNGMITGFKDGNDFIGSMPINLTRSSFKKVLRTGIIINVILLLLLLLLL